MDNPSPAFFTEFMDMDLVVDDGRFGTYGQFNQLHFPSLAQFLRLLDAAIPNSCHRDQMEFILLLTLPCRKAKRKRTLRIVRLGQIKECLCFFLSHKQYAPSRAYPQMSGPSLHRIQKLSAIVPSSARNNPPGQRTSFLGQPWTLQRARPKVRV